MLRDRIRVLLLTLLRYGLEVHREGRGPGGDHYGTGGHGE